MTNRYSYIQPWDSLELLGVYKGIVKFAADLALQGNCSVRVCVNQKNNCQQFIDKAFGATLAQGLLRNETINVHEASFKLESINTLRQEYAHPHAVYFVLFPTAELLEAVEEKQNCASIVVFDEAEDSAGSAHWVTTYSPAALTVTSN